MNWDAVGAGAELLGAIGVIASLFYLGTQIRQNTKTVRTAAYHAIVTNLGNLAADTGRDGAIADLFVRGQVDLESLSPTEQRQFGLLLQGVFRSFENLFYHYSTGMIDEVVWKGWEKRILRYYRQPGVQVWWQTWRDDCHPEFRRLVEGAPLPEGPTVPINLAESAFSD